MSSLASSAAQPNELREAHTVATVNGVAKIRQNPSQQRWRTFNSDRTTATAAAVKHVKPDAVLHGLAVALHHQHGH